MIQLSTIAPDFDDLVTQLLVQLQTKDAWKDRLTSSTGQTLVEMIAAVGAYSQYSIESAFQESYPESAKNKSSLYAAANFLGVRYSRKAPASVQVSLTSPTPITLPVNSQFNGAGTYWFNRQTLNLSPTPTTVTLYQGQIVRNQTFGLGTDFQAFVSPEKEFVVSDTDVFVLVNGISIPVITEGLWTKQGLPGAQQFSLPSGQMILLFGNDIYGTKPSPSDLCELVYAITLGADGSNVPTLDKKFALENDAAVSGTGISQAEGGGSEANPLVYKNVTPALFGSFNASVTPAQYKKLPLQYPGVIDAKTFAQRETNPRALAYMNVIKVSLLTDTVWGSVAWDNFENWFYQNTMYSTRIFREDPVAAPIDVVATIRCKNLANLGQVQLNAQLALTTLLTARQGIIGLDVYRSDIINAIMGADSNIDHVVLTSPATDVILGSLNVPQPTLTVLPTGGTLGPGTYDYGVSVTSSLGGETAPANWGTIEITSGTTNQVVITWPEVSNSLSYKVWGRQTPTPLGLLGSVPAPTTTFTDTGSIVPTGLVPVQSTISSYYPTLNSATLSLAYTTRDSLT